MKDFFAILFLGKTILLTQSPINLNSQWIELALNEPLLAITSGASVLVDVSSLILWREGEDIVDVRKQILEQFPSKSIKAKLITDDGSEVTLVYDGGAMINKEDTLLSLHAEDGVPVGEEFKKMMIYSDLKIDNVRIYWKNHKK